MKIRLFFLGAVCLLFISDVDAQQTDSTLSFLALGDSYTIGENVPEPKRWPVQLVQQLRKQGYQFEDPKLLAATGWTTIDLKNAMEQVDFKPPYDLVTLLIGVNDQYQNFDVNNYAGRFRYLLTRAIKLSGNKLDHVYVLSIPDYGVTPFGQQSGSSSISQEIQAYNEINKQISENMGVHYVDITKISREAANNLSLLTSDGLHPSGRMYSQWVEKLLPILLSSVESWEKK